MSADLVKARIRSDISGEDPAVLRMYHAIKKNIEHHHSAAALTLREMVFARLIAEEGYTQSDAYREAFEPGTDQYASINSMACRIAARPRVQAEIHRVRHAVASSDTATAEIALNGEKARAKMAIELYALANSSADERTRIKAWELFGKLKLVEAFASGSGGSSTVINNLVQTAIQTNQSTDPDVMRSDLIRTLQQLITPEQSNSIKQISNNDSDVIDIESS